MAPHLPRVKAFPIAAEKSFITRHGAALTIPAKEKPKSRLIGKIAPDFELEDHMGRLCSLHATIALGRPIVLYFFPLAGSPHCTVESCSFRDAMGSSPVFQDTNAVVIGISQDPPQRAKRFVDEHKLGYRILFDKDRSVMEAYNVGRALLGLIDQRRTFVIDPNGFIRGVAEGVFDGVGHRKFAERWLVRIEHEMSTRQRQAYWVPVTDDDLAANPEAQQQSMRVTYGAPHSAAVGGIGSQPRYGSVSGSAYPPSTSKTRKQFARSNNGSSGRETPRSSSSAGRHTPDDDSALSDTNSLRAKTSKWSTLVRSRSHEESPSTLDNLWKFRSRSKVESKPEPPIPPAYHNLDDGKKQYYQQVHPREVATSLVLSSLLHNPPNRARTDSQSRRTPTPLAFEATSDGDALEQPDKLLLRSSPYPPRTPHSHSTSLDTASTWAASSRRSTRSIDTQATSDDAVATGPGSAKKEGSRWKGSFGRRSSAAAAVGLTTAGTTTESSSPGGASVAPSSLDDGDDEEFVALNARGDMEVIPRSSSAQGLRATSISGLLGSSLSLNDDQVSDLDARSTGARSRAGTPGPALRTLALQDDETDSNDYSRSTPVQTYAAPEAALMTRKGSISSITGARTVPRPAPPPAGLPPPAPRLSIADDLSNFDVSELTPSRGTGLAGIRTQGSSNSGNSSAGHNSAVSPGGAAADVNRLSSSYASSTGSSHMDSYAHSDARRPSLASSVRSVGTFGPCAEGAGADWERERELSVSSGSGRLPPLSDEADGYTNGQIDDELPQDRRFSTYSESGAPGEPYAYVPPSTSTTESNRPRQADRRSTFGSLPGALPATLPPSKYAHLNGRAPRSSLATISSHGSETPTLSPTAAGAATGRSRSRSPSNPQAHAPHKHLADRYVVEDDEVDEGPPPPVPPKEGPNVGTYAQTLPKPQMQHVANGYAHTQAHGYAQQHYGVRGHGMGDVGLL